MAMAEAWKQIICVVLIFFLGWTSFAAPEPNEIDFGDAFYAGLLRTTMSRMVNDPNYCMSSINVEATTARQKYEEMTLQWCDPNLTASAYQEAATWILTHIELNEKRWLTLGAVLQVLGIPDKIYFYGNRFNEKDGMEPDTERFAVQYLEKKISVEFSVMGFVRIVRNVDSISSIGRFYWPRQFYDAEEYPIVSFGLVGKEEFSNEDMKTLMTFLEDRCRNWKNKVKENWAAAGNGPESLQIHVELMLIDVITKDLVDAFYEIKHDDATLYKNLWCYFDGNKWVILQDDQVQIVSCSKTHPAAESDDSQD